MVKAFTHEEQAKDQFRKLNETYRDAAQKANFYSTMIMPVSGNLMKDVYKRQAFFGGIKNARFKRQVVPGDVLELRCELTRQVGSAVSYTHLPQVEEMVRVVAEERVMVVTTGAGNPGAYIPCLLYTSGEGRRTGGL